MTAAHLFTATAQEGDDVSKEISSYEDCIKHLPPIVCDVMGYPPAATPTGGHTPTVVAALSPLPTTVDFKADGTKWHQFTVSASEQIKVVANPGPAARRVEIATRDRTTTLCPAEQNDSYSRNDGQSLYLSACKTGTGRVQLQRKSNGEAIRTYDFTIDAKPTATDTPKPTPVPTITVNITASDTSPTVGQSVTLSAAVQPSSSNGYKYQWQRKNGNSWTKYY